MERLLKLSLVALLGVAFFYGTRLLGLDRILTLDGMRDWVASWGSFGPLAFVGVCVLGIVLYLPESALLALGGAVFGGWTAFACGWFASVIGTTITFLIARYIARDWVQRTLAGRGDRFRRLDERFARNGFAWVCLLRTVLGLAPPLNWVVGASSVSFPAYAAGTALGVVPSVALFTYLGGSIAEAAEGGSWWTPELLLAAALVALFVVVGVVLGRRILGSGAG